MKRLLVALTVFVSPWTVLAEDSALSQSVPRALFEYVERPEPAFRWEVKGQQETEQGNVVRLHLVSQTWHDIVWEHALMVYEPKELRHPGYMLLFVTGGSNGGEPGRRDMERGLQLARLCGARVATIHQVPNQPLFDGRKEDDLITETWLRYLKTGDETWPLLFPMVKSAVKAMDALEEFNRTHRQQELEGFVITGASKRGWTSWLTPVADKRIVATAPIVIDTLNFRSQMKHQLDTWGRYSEQIIDYTSKGLVNVGDESPRERHLRRMMDPYTYREQLTLPKLMINGTNDRYWVVDALNNYWDGLVGPKHVLYVPNAGHGLDGGVELALSTLAAFFHRSVQGRHMPELKWNHSDRGNSLRLVVTSKEQPRAVKLWTAHSDSKDFRQSEWSAVPMKSSGNGEFMGEVERPAKGHIALYGEAVYALGEFPFSLSTQIRTE